MPSIFTRIIEGSIPCHKIAENDRCFAFLDIQPLQKGHTLVVPKLEVDYLFDLPTEDYHALWSFAAEISHAIKAAFPCDRIGVAVVGLEVPHAHIHLIPINRMSDMSFENPRVRLSTEEFDEAAKLIRSKL